MIRALLTFAINLVLAAIALLVTAWLVAGVSIQTSGFLVAVLVFALAQAILSPFVFNMARKYASAVLGGVGIVSCLLALWVATLLSSGLTINGLGTWVEAALIVWAITALGGWFLSWLVITKWWGVRVEAKKLGAATARNESAAER